jgi:hypothetical protein
MLNGMAEVALQESGPLAPSNDPDMDLSSRLGGESPFGDLVQGGHERLRR